MSEPENETTALPPLPKTPEVIGFHRDGDGSDGLYNYIEVLEDRFHAIDEGTMPEVAKGVALRIISNIVDDLFLFSPGFAVDAITAMSEKLAEQNALRHDAQAAINGYLQELREQIQ